MYAIFKGLSLTCKLDSICHIPDDALSFCSCLGVMWRPIHEDAKGSNSHLSRSITTRNWITNLLRSTESKIQNRCMIATSITVHVPLGILGCHNSRY